VDEVTGNGSATTFVVVAPEFVVGVTGDPAVNVEGAADTLVRMTYLMTTPWGLFGCPRPQSLT
jgi:hypothetical protein